MSRATDETLRSYAKSNDMVVITADLDYPRLLALTQEQGPSTILSEVAITAENRP